MQEIYNGGRESSNKIVEENKGVFGIREVFNNSDKPIDDKLL